MRNQKIEVNNIFTCFCQYSSLADPGGAAGARPPQQDPFLSFSHMFLPKSVCVGGRRPPTGNPGSATALNFLLTEEFNQKKLPMLSAGFITLLLGKVAEELYQKIRKYLILLSEHTAVCRSKI